MEKGLQQCSNAASEHPELCGQCTMGLISAIEEKLKDPANIANEQLFGADKENNDSNNLYGWFINVGLVVNAALTISIVFLMVSGANC